LVFQSPLLGDEGGELLGDVHVHLGVLLF